MTAISQDARTLSVSDLNTTINHEPRVRDLTLAERLEFASPITIRKLIERNRVELETHGVLSTVEITSSAKGGRPGKEYYLNEGQALVICALSRTPAAAAVRHDLITVYMEYRRGQLAHQPAPALPPPSDRSANLGDRVDTVIRAMADLVEFTRGTAADNARLRRETEKFAAIKAILMGETK